MRKKRMLVFDSGAGGLNVFTELVKRYPQDEFCYLSDSKNAPYGEKTLDELFESSVKALKEYILDFDGLILACNTLSANCKDKLEKEFSKPVFGLKPEPDGKRSTLILCTRATARACEKNFADTPFCETFVPEKWVEKIESDLPHVDEEFFFCSLKDFFGKKYAVVMLGCTHFIYVKKVVQSVFPTAELKDGTESLFEKTDIFLTKSLGQTATEQQCGEISEKNFIGEDSARNFGLFRRLTNSKSY